MGSASMWERFHSAQFGYHGSSNYETLEHKDAALSRSSPLAVAFKDYRTPSYTRFGSNLSVFRQMTYLHHKAVQASITRNVSATQEISHERRPDLLEPANVHSGRSAVGLNRIRYSSRGTHSASSPSTSTLSLFSDRPAFCAVFFHCSHSVHALWHSALSLSQLELSSAMACSVSSFSRVHFWIF